MKTITTILLIAALTGCVSHGTRFDMNHVDTMKPGTPISEATALLGKPNHTSNMGDGSTLLQWMYISGAGSRNAAILFDKDGKMIRVTSKAE